MEDNMSKVLHIKVWPAKNNSLQFSVLPACLVLAIIFSVPAKAASQTDVNLNSTSWWLGCAVKQAADITDPNDKDDIYGHLGRAQALAGDVNGANVSASAISNLSKRVYVYIFAAKTFYKQGNQPGYNKSTEQAKLAALSENKIESQIFINGSMVSAYLDCNDVNGAKSYTESVKVDSEKQRAYRTIAAHLACKGNIENADAIVNDIIKESGKEGALLEIAETCVRGGNLAVAEQIAQRITRAEFKDRVYGKIGVAFAESGNLEKARAASVIISDPKQKSSVIAAIAKYQITAGDINLGEKTTQEITYRDNKIAVYTLIAEKQADTGKIDSAVATIEMMGKMIDDTPMAADKSKFGTFDDSFKKGAMETVYLRIANSLAKKGDINGYNRYVAKAIEGVKEMNDIPVWKGAVFVKIVESQLEAGDIEGAKTTVKEINDELNHSWALYNIVKTQLDKDDIAGAMATYREITSAMNKSFACGQIASALVKKGKMPEAKQILLTLGTSAIEAEAYRGTARVFVEMGYTKELANWLDEIPTPQAKVCACIGAVDGIMKTEKSKLSVN
jgi:thioredoxin-like negative regulator of GroEL